MLRISAFHAALSLRQLIVVLSRRARSFCRRYHSSHAVGIMPAADIADLL